jgi:hypothetical protein
LLIADGKPLTTPQIARSVYRTTKPWHKAPSPSRRRPDIPDRGKLPRIDQFAADCVVCSSLPAGPMTTGALTRRAYGGPFRKWHLDYVRRTLPGIAVDDGSSRQSATIDRKDC